MTDSLSTLVTSADVGGVNRARVMRALYRHGPLSRSDLAKQLDVSRATITAVVQPLISATALRELPARSTTAAGGKPPRPLWFGSDRCIGAVYLGADEITVATVAKDGTVLQRHDVALPRTSDPEAFLEALRSALVPLRDQPLLGIGIGLAGMVDTDEGRVLLSFRAPVLSGMPVGAHVASWFDVPVHIDHHPRVQAIGDQWFGLGRDLTDFVSVFTGEVLGAGVVMAGRVVRGPRGAGGEAGHMMVDARGSQCECGRRGCWETVATLPWLRAEAVRTRLTDGDLATSRRLSDLADEGSEEAERLLDRYARNLAEGMGNLDQLLGLHHYIVHGDAVGGGERMRARIAGHLAAASPDRGGPPVVTLAEPSDDATILGAAGLVLSHVYACSL
ncbi:ROK family transcriptional regulator [Phycicoccus sp. BSK3Z-2]|uniref:ROK family transcriptional regulator n=1 Tax=Phycicoccus avicenniae TaxID=2828860 RepID=A0A941HZ19_9MICO|nr:ROK family transcriptional regulator [Phycicoccus avicenniae]MBR7742477.1 ROK family transcriptional regulator [Phycicoccus avicenniae]